MARSPRRSPQKLLLKAKAALSHGQVRLAAPVRPPRTQIQRSEAPAQPMGLRSGCGLGQPGPLSQAGAPAESSISTPLFRRCLTLRTTYAKTPVKVLHTIKGRDITAATVYLVLSLSIVRCTHTQPVRGAGGVESSSER